MPEINIEEAKIKLRALQDFYYFNKYILGYNLLDTIHKEQCDFVVNTPGDLLLLEPRDHFKTTNVTIGFTIWALCRDKSQKILINHKILKGAKKILSEIIQQFENNKILRHFFGDMVGDKNWTKDSISLKGALTGKDPNVSIGSVDHPNTGSHYTLIINDDICELADRYSEAEREATLQFYKAVQYVKDAGRNPREINIGTRWHMNDLWSVLLTRKHITNRVRKAYNDDGTVYLPSRFTIEKLTQLKEDDVEFFETVMMQNPIMDADRIFKLDELHFYDPKAIDYEAGITKAYEDPALSGKQSACDTALAIGCGIESNIYLRGWHLWKVTPDTGMNNVLDECSREGVIELKVESNQAFAIYAEDLRKLQQQRGDMFSIVDAPATTDKIGRIRAISSFIKQNVYFRTDWQTVYPKAMTQLLEFPQSKLIDGVDALEGLCSMFVSGRGPRMRRLGIPSEE